MLIDEGLERVDDDNSMRVLQMLKHFMKLNFLNQVILVTHKTILKDQKNINYIELRRDE